MLDPNNLMETKQEIGHGRFGICTLAMYGGRCVVVKKNRQGQFRS